MLVHFKFVAAKMSAPEPSQLRDVFAIRENLKKADEKCVALFKESLFRELDIKDERQFLSFVLLHARHVFAPDVIQSLCVKSAQLCQTHPKKSLSEYELNMVSSYLNLPIMLQSELVKNHSDRDTELESVKESVVKRRKMHHLLADDVLETIGSFLLRQESIYFGQVSTRIFRVTHKKSYLLKQLDPEWIIMDQGRYRRLFQWRGSEPVAYQYPLKLVLRELKVEHANVSWFKLLFTRLKGLQIYNCEEVLPYIPLSFLCKNNFSTNTIEELTMDNSRTSDTSISSFSDLCDTHWSNITSDLHVRKVGLLSLVAKATHLKRLAICFGPTKFNAIHWECVDDGTGTQEICMTFAEAQTILHPQLLMLSLGSGFKLKMSTPKPNCHILKSNVQHVRVFLEEDDDWQRLSSLDTYDCRSTIKSYTFILGNADVEIPDLLTAVFLEHKEKHPQLKHVTFETVGFSALTSFEWMCENAQQLLDRSTCIQFDFVCRRSFAFGREFEKKSVQIQTDTKEVEYVFQTFSRRKLMTIKDRVDSWQHRCAVKFKNPTTRTLRIIWGKTDGFFA